MRPNITALAAVLCACAPPPAEPAPGEGQATPSAQPDLPEADDADDSRDPTPSRGLPPRDADEDPSTATEGGEDGSDFLPYVDLGGSISFECDLYTQDCPAGFKCAPYANDGGGAWNATKCAEIVPHPDQDGELCTVIGSGVSGEDSCDVGHMCWDVDPETNQGMCVPFCIGDDSNPQCADPGKVCSVSKSFALCLEECDPLAPIAGPAQQTDEGLEMCPVGCACYPLNEGFACAPDVSGEMGAAGETCEFINVCDPGTFCLGAAAITTCEGAGCCVPVCDLDDPWADTICYAFDPGTSCEAWFAESEAPPGNENVGVCVVPG